MLVTFLRFAFLFKLPAPHKPNKKIDSEKIEKNVLKIFDPMPKIRFFLFSRLWVIWWVFSCVMLLYFLVASPPL